MVVRVPTGCMNDPNVGANLESMSLPYGGVRMVSGGLPVIEPLTRPPDRYGVSTCRYRASNESSVRARNASPAGLVNAAVASSAAAMNAPPSARARAPGVTKSNCTGNWAVVCAAAGRATIQRAQRSVAQRSRRTVQQNVGLMKVTFLGPVVAVLPSDVVIVSVTSRTVFPAAVPNEPHGIVSSFSVGPVNVLVPPKKFQS